MLYEVKLGRAPHSLSSLQFSSILYILLQFYTILIQFCSITYSIPFYLILYTLLLSPSLILLHRPLPIFSFSLFYLPQKSTWIRLQNFGGDISLYQTLLLPITSKQKMKGKLHHSLFHLLILGRGALY